MPYTNCIFFSQSDSLQIILFPSIFSLHSTFCIDNFHNLNILQHHMIIAFTFTVTKIPNKFFITTALINQFFTFTSAFIFISTLFIIKNTYLHLHLHLQVPYYFICLVSLVLHIRLHTLTFMFLITSETHNCAYGSLILLQLALHLLILTL